MLVSTQHPDRSRRRGRSLDGHGVAVARRHLTKHQPSAIVRRCGRLKAAAAADGDAGARPGVDDVNLLDAAPDHGAGRRAGRAGGCRFRLRRRAALGSRGLGRRSRDRLPLVAPVFEEVRDLDDEGSIGGRADRFRAAPVLLDRVPEVVADPPVDALLAAVDEPVHLLHGAVEREGLLDDERLADVVHGQGGDRLVDLVLTRVSVNAHEVEVLGDLRRVEHGLGVRPDLRPGDDADGDRRPGVRLADRPGQLRDPGLGDLDTRPPLRGLRDPLDEVEAAEFAADPARLPLLGRPADDRLVHQVVAEHRGMAGTRLGDLLPPACLNLPALRLVERVVPGGDAVEAVAAQAGHVEVQAAFAGEVEHLPQPVELLRVEPVRPRHVRAELEVDPHDVRAELPHLAEVPLDPRPVLVPRVLHQLAELPEVVEAPRDERLAGLAEHEVPAVAGDPHLRHRRRFPLGRANRPAGERAEQGEHRGREQPGSRAGGGSCLRCRHVQLSDRGGRLPAPFYSSQMDECLAFIRDSLVSG